MPADGSNAASNKDFGTVPLAARGADYSAWGRRERGECALPLGHTHEPETMQYGALARGHFGHQAGLAEATEHGPEPGFVQPGASLPQIVSAQSSCDPLSRPWLWW